MTTSEPFPSPSSDLTAVSVGRVGGDTESPQKEVNVQSAASDAGATTDRTDHGIASVGVSLAENELPPPASSGAHRVAVPAVMVEEEPEDPKAWDAYEAVLEEDTGFGGPILLASASAAAALEPDPATDPDPDPDPGPEPGGAAEPSEETAPRPEAGAAARIEATAAGDSATDAEDAGSAQAAGGGTAAASIAAVATTSGSRTRTDAQAADGEAGAEEAGAQQSRGRVRGGWLAVGATAAAILVAVPLLLTGGGDGPGRKPAAASGDAARTDLGGWEAGAAVPNGFDSASPDTGKATSPKDKTGKSDGKSGSADTKSSAHRSSGMTPTPTSSSATSPRTPKKSTSGHRAPAEANSVVMPSGDQIVSHASGRCIGVVGGTSASSGAGLEIRDCRNTPSQFWTIKSDGTIRAMGKCMNVGGGGTSNGTGIGWTTCNGTGAQQFRLSAAHDLTNPQSGNKCVDVVDQGTGNGTRLQLWTCGGTDNQKWSKR